MARTIIDINILHTVPPSNVNRDDTGSPKTAVYGGVRRARVSSQAWKRAARLDFATRLDRDQLGERTKRVVEALAERIRTLDAAVDEDRAIAIAGDLFKMAGIKTTVPKGAKDAPGEAGYLLFLSSRQLDRLAAIGVEALAAEDSAAVIKAADLKKTLNTEHSVDISLFGRMVAESSDLNVDAAAQVAHAISVHAVQNEFDYFTAVDDLKSKNLDEIDAGAAMIGTIEFNSSTLYRYATVDVDALLKNLGSADATRRAVEAFVESFIVSMPTGKQNTFANRTLPDAVVISLRDTQSVNLVGAFEEAVVGNHIATAAQRLTEYAQSIDTAYGTTPVQSWVIRANPAAAAVAELGEQVSLAAALSALGENIASRISAS